jgi:hypothetical protein
VVGLAVLLPACSQGARADQAERVRRSIPRVAGRTVAGTLTLDLRALDVDPTRRLEVRAARSLGTVAYVADAAAARTALRPKPGDLPVFISAGRTLYARRPAKTATEKRPWYRVDLEQLGDVSVPSFSVLGEKSGPGDATVVGPQLMIDLLAGVLTGSFRQGAPTADGTTTYRFNVSIDKADRVLRRKDDDRKDRQKVLRSLAITDDVHKGEATLRPDGSLARLRITFTERPDKQATLALAADLVTDQPGGASAAPVDVVPDHAATVRVAALADIRGAVADLLKPAGPPS